MDFNVKIDVHLGTKQIKVTSIRDNAKRDTYNWVSFGYFTLWFLGIESLKSFRDSLTKYIDSFELANDNQIKTEGSF